MLAAFYSKLIILYSLSCDYLSSRQASGKLEVLRLSIQLLVDWLLVANELSSGMFLLLILPLL